jgi:precorrin-6A/cobalt-precorrin-6A reductase
LSATLPVDINQSRKILVLGGTSDAVEIASRLTALGFPVIYSLAGVTREPKLPAAKLRIGGFGGEKGLTEYLLQNKIEILIDATHPFAAIISRNATHAAASTGIRHFRFERPAWQPEINQDWTMVASAEAAAACLPKGARVFVTIGRKEIAPFLARSDLTGTLRMIEEPDVPMPVSWRLDMARPPFTVENEMQSLVHCAATHLVTKNSGGTPGKTKLAAARELGVAIVMIERPPKSGGEVVGEVSELLRLVAEQGSAI